jgi:acetyl/propionyl-CoA carboxylase alpha subunit/acetyl-CoA carboxylase carboxyltransferase component
MPIQKLLVANRGEIAVRVLRAAADLGVGTVAVCSTDDARSLHVRRADAVHALPGRGARAYLDVDAIVAAAVETGCDAIHPGYGFLSESAMLARACAKAGVAFVGPSPEVLEQLGDKGTARRLAAACDVPVLEGTDRPTTVEEARAFLASLGEGAGVVVKAIAGGGGRGMRVVDDPAKLEAAVERCRSEAAAAFGCGDVYVERRIARARHVEVQIVGDGESVSHVFERECTLQRRHQKLVEVAPSPSLAAELRTRLLEAALAMARHLGYAGLGTFEFLLDADDPQRFAFIEANPRLQVEHTVTEAVTGIDLVQAQIRIAGGARLAELGLDQASIPAPRGHAVQARINMETIGDDGAPRPSGGTITRYEPATGPGLRVDGYGYAGYTTSPAFDSLLAKLVAHSPSSDFGRAVDLARRGLRETCIEGVATNVDFLVDLLGAPEVRRHDVTTLFVERFARARAETEPAATPPLHFEAGTPGAPAGRGAAARLAGAGLDPADPLAVLAHGRAEGAAGSRDTAAGAPHPAPAPRTDVAPGPPGSEAVAAPVQGTVVSIAVEAGTLVRAGQPLLVMEAMKMEHVVEAPVSGEVVALAAAVGDTVFEGEALLHLSERTVAGDAEDAATEEDPDHVRPDLAEVRERHAFLLDESRPEAVARRRRTGQRTARENIADLCDPGSFIEYGGLAVAAQRRRRTLDDLIRNTPADGMVTGVGSVNGDLFPDADSRCLILSYDYTVLAGTQGSYNHAKKDRMFELAADWRLPLVIFTEGGGGRPGDTDGTGVAGLDCWAFHYFGKLSGLVPLVGINSGRCFAGNAALLGCCDVVIATANSNIGMGGPAMIEGGGLGIYRPDEVGPMSDQVPNGVVDVAVADEAEAVAVARQYLSYFQGPVDAWTCADQRRLRHVIPENRLRIYDVRRVVELMADEGSVLELRRGFGHGMVTALVRVEGRPLGVIANNPAHLAGAIDREGADKAARFMQLCDAFDLPILFLCDTPGIMVGPDSERTALVRHASRMFVVGASLSVPFFTIVLRKGYGLGAQAMAGGSFKAPFFTISWPTGEFGGMGLEGAVKLGYRKELEAKTDPAERKALFDEMVARMYEHGKAINMASHLEIDEVIDPMDSRTWIVRALRSTPPTPPRTGKKRPCVDTW